MQTRPNLGYCYWSMCLQAARVPSQLFGPLRSSKNSSQRPLCFGQELPNLPEEGWCRDLQDLSERPSQLPNLHDQAWPSLEVCRVRWQDLLHLKIAGSWFQDLRCFPEGRGAIQGRSRASQRLSSSGADLEKGANQVVLRTRHHRR